MARPRVRILSVDRIVDAAIALIDSGEPLSITKLGARLSVNPSSLYNHVSGLSQIVELVRGKLAEDFQIAVPPDLAWDGVVEYVVRRQRAMFAAHPRVLPLLVAQTVTDPRVLSYYNVLATALVDAGFHDNDVLDIIAALDAFALGFGLDMSAPTEVWQTGETGTALGRLLAGNSDDGSKRSERAFELALGFYLDALRLRLNSRSSGEEAGARPA